VNILLVDDDLLSRRILQDGLLRIGHACRVASDGEEAWELFLAERPEVLISDWIMPGIDGLQLCRRTRAEPGPYTYVIVLSSLTDKESVLEGMVAGADDYLVKPAELADVQVKLIAAARIVALYQRIGEQTRALEALNRELASEMRRDPLTQLGNRLRLREDFDGLAARLGGSGEGYCAAMCDIDHFKPYNDQAGHLAGDDALRAVAAAMSANVRGGDLLYRYGGEEFLAVMPGVGIDGARATAERVRRAVEALDLLNPGLSPPLPLTVSIGVAEARPGEAGRPRDLLARADAALYTAKSRGRNRVEVAG
jgi:diguanylate cyclase (GGDEF)-like protein